MATNTEASSVATDDFRPLRIAVVREEAQDIVGIDLVDPDGGELASFDAGAHVVVSLGEHGLRQYSLCNAPTERHRYRIAVLREPDGRGGSEHVHTRWNEGDTVEVRGPENHFALVRRAVKRHLLLAGGIGVTPMLSMLHTLDADGRPYTLHYCTRSKARTAFLDELDEHVADGRVVLHHDEGDPAQGLDIAGTLTDYPVGTHLYACGPPGFMAAVDAATGAWPPHAVHQEYFAARELSEEERAWDAKGFSVRLAKRDRLVDVAGGQSIVEALREHGVDIQTDCTEGYCGTCITRYLDGEPVHRDSVLDEAGRADHVMICCARCRTDELVLDL